MWKAIVEMLRVFTAQNSQSSSSPLVLEVPETMNSEKAGDLVEAMIGELMITYPDGKYETAFPFRAVWVLPSMTNATPTDKAVLRMLELVAIANDIAAAKPPNGASPHAWASDVLNTSDFMDYKNKLVDDRPPLEEGQKATSAVKAFRKQKRQERLQERKKSKNSDVD